MALTQFLDKPAVVGQYVDMRDCYDIVLPCPGAPLNELNLGVIAVEDVEAAMNVWKARHDASQAMIALDPVLWHHVGFHVDAVTLAVTGYYQLQLPTWLAPAEKVWTNFPDEPAIYADPWPTA